MIFCRKKLVIGEKHSIILTYHFRVIMVGYLRPELNYTTLENLKTAIQGDIDNAKLEMEKPEFISFKTHPFFSS